MNWIRGLVLLTLCSLSLNLWAAQEMQLGRIRIGMRPSDVTDILGDPPAKLMPQPPVMVRTIPTDGSSMTTDTSGPTASIDPPNTLIFLYQPRPGVWNEVEIGTSEVSPTGTLMTSGAESTGTMGGAQGSTTTKSNAQIPSWAYAVRVTKLSLNQEEWIYKINSYYSLGVTFTGQGAEKRVSDVIACSYEPLVEVFDKHTKTFHRKSVQPEEMNFNYAHPTKRKFLPAGTSQGVLIGSRMPEVLKKHKWPQFFFPFVGGDLTMVSLDEKRPLGDIKVPVPIRDISAYTGGGTGGTGEMSTGADGVIPAYGDKPVCFTDGDLRILNCGFSKNCVLLYTQDQVAFTLVDFTVVRIQIGKGVVKPPDPPKIKM